MADAIIGRKPAKMSIGQLNSGRSIEAQYNPTELEEALEANWQYITILGMSHEQPQYTHTKNHGFKFDMPFSAFDRAGNKINEIQAIRRFLLSLMYSGRGGQDIVSGSPSRVLFVWPTMVSLTSIVKKVKIKHTDFNNEGTSIRFVASIELDEIRDVRLYAEDVESKGTNRS